MVKIYDCGLKKDVEQWKLQKCFRNDCQALATHFDGTAFHCRWHKNKDSVLVGRALANELNIKRVGHT